MNDLGKTGYDAYAVSTGGKTYDGRDMPRWDGLTDKIRNAWSAAARAVTSAAGLPHPQATVLDDRADHECG